MDEKEIVTKVRQCVATALGRDEDEVQVGKKLQTDLEAESIDYLDITFQLEKVSDVMPRPLPPNASTKLFAIRL